MFPPIIETAFYFLLLLFALSSNPLKIKSAKIIP